MRVRSKRRWRLVAPFPYALIFLAAHLPALQSAPDAAKEVKEFYRLARPEQVAGELSTRDAVDYLIDLPTDKQLIVARALIQDHWCPN